MGQASEGSNEWPKYFSLLDLFCCQLIYHLTAAALPKNPLGPVIFLGGVGAHDKLEKQWL
jgi:hypothetical protein